MTDDIDVLLLREIHRMNSEIANKESEIASMKRAAHALCVYARRLELSPLNERQLGANT